MSEADRRCPSCDATVAPDASWCWRCFATLAEIPPDPIADPTPAVPAAPGGAVGEIDAGQGKVEPWWPCPVCDGHNPIAADVCATCGTPFSTVMRTDPDRREVSPRDAVLWSLIFPGLGHRLAGRPTDALARGVLFTMSIGMAALLLFAGKAAPVTTAVLVLFVAAAVGVYILSAVEADRIAHGGEVLVGSRLLLWILVGMTFISVGAIALAVISASPG